MNCPKCRSNELKLFTSKEGVKIDFCSSCKGIWLDKGELAMYMNDSADLPSKRIDFEKLKDTNYFCPRCGDFKLGEMPYMKGSDLLIDFCNNCSGIWLDAVEIVKVSFLSRKVPAVIKVAETIKALEKTGFSS